MSINIKNLKALKLDLNIFSLQYANVLSVPLQEEYQSYLTILWQNTYENISEKTRLGITDLLRYIKSSIISPF